MRNIKSNSGFTLLELVASLALLGVAAASATPAMMSLESAAEDAKIDAAIAAVGSGMMMTRARWIVDGSPNPNGYSQVHMEGDQIELHSGWPVLNDVALVAGISCDIYGCFGKPGGIQITATEAPKEGEACFVYEKPLTVGGRYFVSERMAWSERSGRCG